MIDEFQQWKESSDRGAESLVSIVRVVFLLFRRPRLLFTVIVLIALIGALQQHGGWLILVAVVCFCLAFAIWRNSD
jgi:hypothetical protein